jgi:hypothetical protein
LGTYESPRRYYARKAQAARREGSPLYEAWLAKQLAMPGTALPSDFPYLAVLNDNGYFAVEDLFGADARELLRVAYLTNQESARVLEALAPLLPVPT